MSQLPYEQFGNYLLLRRIGVGGMAEVFLARPVASIANGRFLIIKRILAGVSDDTHFVRMFRSETKVCMGLNHPNIVQIFDFGEHGGCPFIAMEFVEGKTFRQIMNEYIRRGEGTTPIEIAVSLITQTAAGLHYAHRFINKATGKPLGIIHRDISPQNLIVSYDGNVKIIDFGIAKASLDSSYRTQTGIIKGKINYLSPEQLQGENIDARSDIFSTGLVLWELLTNKKALPGEGPAKDIEVLKMLQNCEKHILPPSFENPEIPNELDQIVMAALHKDPAQRYPSAQEFQKALRNFLADYRPGFSYSDVGATITGLFQSQIQAELQRDQELNERAQEWLDQTDVTRRISPPPFDLNKLVKPPPSPPPLRAEPISYPITAVTEAPFYQRRFPMATVALIFFAVLLDRRFLLFDWVFQMPDSGRGIPTIRIPVNRTPRIQAALLGPERPFANTEEPALPSKMNKKTRGLASQKTHHRPYKRR